VIKHPNPDRLSSAATCSTQPKLKKGNLADSSQEGTASKPTRPVVFQRPEYKFKWVPPVKVFPAKYGPAKVKILQSADAHAHHKSHKLNVFFDQYNEFVRLIFKNQKASAQEKKLDLNYAVGLARALGLRANKDTFSEQNMKSRDHLTQLKEKLYFRFLKKIAAENKELLPTPPQGKLKKQSSEDS
jgi:hypothetical protein